MRIFINVYLWYSTISFFCKQKLIFLLNWLNIFVPSNILANRNHNICSFLLITCTLWQGHNYYIGHNAAEKITVNKGIFVLNVSVLLVQFLKVVLHLIEKDFPHRNKMHKKAKDIFIIYIWPHENLDSLIWQAFLLMFGYIIVFNFFNP